MFFYLYNTSTRFQFYINKTLQEFLDNFCTAYFDNIFICKENKSACTNHVQQIPWKLRVTQLFMNICKYDFSVNDIQYLELIISIIGFKIDCIKVSTIQNWKNPLLCKRYIIFSQICKLLPEIYFKLFGDCYISYCSHKDYLKVIYVSLKISRTRTESIWISPESFYH